jgi:hypothetical protein
MDYLVVVGVVSVFALAIGAFVWLSVRVVTRPLGAVLGSARNWAIFLGLFGALYLVIAVEKLQRHEWGVAALHVALAVSWFVVAVARLRSLRT